MTDGQYTLPNSDVIDDGTLVFSQTFDGTYGGTISTSSVTSNVPSGSNNYTPLGNLTKNSAGVVLLTGNNTYIGSTTISGGALVADSTASLPGYNVGGKVVVTSGAAKTHTSLPAGGLPGSISTASNHPRPLTVAHTSASMSPPPAPSPTTPPRIRPMPESTRSEVAI